MPFSVIETRPTETLASRAISLIVIFPIAACLCGFARYGENQYRGIVLSCSVFARLHKCNKHFPHVKSGHAEKKHPRENCGGVYVRFGFLRPSDYIIGGGPPGPRPPGPPGPLRPLAALFMLPNLHVRERIT